MRGGNILNPSETCYRRTISAIGFVLLIWFFLMQLLGMTNSLLLPLLTASFWDDHEILSTLLNDGIYAAGYLFCFMFPVFFLKKFIRRTGVDYQPMDSMPRISPWLPLMAFGTITIVFSAAHLNFALMDLIGYHPEEILIGVQIGSADPKLYELILDFITICLIPGFCEEFLFRGAILSNCLPFGEGKAIFISALLFSLMHQNPSQIFYTFVAGLLLGFIYVKTKSIWNCVIIHILNNFFSYVESIIMVRIKDQPLALTYATLIELLLVLLGVISIVILVLRFFSQKDTNFCEGCFGKSLAPGAEYALVPISHKRTVKLFLTPSMTVFLALCVAQIVVLFVTVLIGGSIFELLG